MPLFTGNTMRSKRERGFIRWSFASIISVLLLILAGGIVRSSGSGMGCPDWPRCFNKLIPPTDISELPADYKENFLKKRLAKNNHSAGFFDWLGYHKLASEIRSDPTVYKVESFNVWNTYTEYVNRLVSVLVGILFIVTWVYSFGYLKSKPGLFIIWTFGLFLIGFQGWLGSIVVSSNLFAWLITLHMLLALVILVLAIGAFTWASGLKGRDDTNTPTNIFFKVFAGFMIFLATAQILAGTGIREQLDLIAQQLSQQHRNKWVSMVGDIFSWHIYLSLFVTVGVVILYMVLQQGGYQKLRMFKVAKVNLALIGIQMVTGILLAAAALPPAAQTLHIFLASLVFGNLVYIFMLGSSRTRDATVSKTIF